MVFLNPWFLLGLAAAAIPVLIHLLHVKKLRTVEFSSLRFLKELQRSRIRTVRIRQLLLLLVRTLLIIALVLAFARPAVHGSFFGMFGGRESRTTLIVVDDSPSMTVRDERGVRFEQARRAALRIAAMAGDQDRVIYTAASQVQLAVPSAAASKPALERAIAGASPTPIHTPFAEMLDRLARPLNETPRAEREIILITDAQASHFALPAQTGVVPDPMLHAALVQVGSGVPENTAVVGVDVESQVLAPNKPIRLRITLRHAGTHSRGDAFISVYLDGIRVAQQSADLPPDRFLPVTMEIVPKHPGPIAGYVQIEDDALDADNIRHFCVRIPERVNVLAIGESPADTEYPLLALTLRGDTTFGRSFRVTAAPRARLGAFDARTCDVLLLCGLRSITPGEAAAIARFTEGGGGVILFTPPDAEASTYTDLLLPALGLPRTIPGRPRPAEPPTGDAGFVTFSSVDQDHPLLRDLLERTGRNRSSPVRIESPKVTRTFPIPAYGTAQRIIGLSDGSAFLTEIRAGKGRLLWFAVDPGIRSSDFPLRGIYAPLLHRAVLYLAGNTDADRAFHPGEPIVLTLPEGSIQDPAQLVVRSPSGLDEQFTPEAGGPQQQGAVRTGPAMELGVYEMLERETGPGKPAVLALAAVTVDTAESDLRPVTDEQLRLFWQSRGIEPGRAQRLPDDGTLEQAILEARSGTELWRLFAGLALLCALLEMFIARVARNEVPDA